MVRLLRLLQWRQVDFLREEITVGKSKTKGGEGRVVPLSNTVLRRLKEWWRQFPDATPAHYLFPSERYGLHSSKGAFGGGGKDLWLRSRDANRRLEVLVDDLPQTVWRPVPMARYAPHVHIVWERTGWQTRRCWHSPGCYEEGSNGTVTQEMSRSGLL
jgi:hypothetical protein